MRYLTLVSLTCLVKFSVYFCHAMRFIDFCRFVKTSPRHVAIMAKPEKQNIFTNHVSVIHWNVSVLHHLQIRDEFINIIFLMIMYVKQIQYRPGMVVIDLTTEDVTGKILKIHSTRLMHRPAVRVVPGLLLWTTHVFYH